MWSHLAWLQEYFRGVTLLDVQFAPFEEHSSLLPGKVDAVDTLTTTLTVDAVDTLDEPFPDDDNEPSVS